jgi:hypothetical protein
MTAPPPDPSGTPGSPRPSGPSGSKGPTGAKDSAPARSASTAGPTPGRPVPPRPPSGARTAVTILVALVLSVLVWVIAGPIAGLDLHAGDMSVNPGTIIPVVVVTGILAWLLRLALMHTTHGVLIWTITAGVVLLLSLLGPILLGAGGGALAALLVMHILSGGALILGLRGARGAVHASRTSSRTVPGTGSGPSGGERPGD